MGSMTGTASVIAKLMGLDDLPNQHPNQKRGRVLSEKYFQRVASIGVRERSPSPENYSFGMSPERPEDFCSFINVMGTSRQDKLRVREVENRNSHLNRNVKIRQLEETSYALESLCENSSTPMEIALVRPHHGAERDSLSVFSRPRSHKGSTAGHMKSKDFRGPSRCWRDSSDEIELVGQRPRVTSEEVEEISRELKFINTESGSLYGPSGKKSQNRPFSATSANSSFIAWEAKKEISQRFTTMEFQELGSSSRRKTLGEMLLIHSHQMSPQISNYSSRGSRKGMMNGTHVINRSKRSEPSGHPFVYRSRERSFTSKDELQPRKATSFDTRAQNLCSSNSECNSLISAAVSEFDDWANEAGDISGEKNLPSAKECDPASRSFRAGTNLCETLAWSSQMKESVSSSANSSENLSKEAEPTEFVEEDSASSHSSMGPESFKSFEEAYQPSPDSVLRPFEEETSSDLGNDLSEMQFLPFKLDSLEQCPQGHRMSLSSEEEDNTGLSFSNFQETKDYTRSLRAEESRDFSYLVDVLSEAGLHGGNLVESLIKWQSTESPADSVFEVLEKKYGEQKSWRRSERKLFFDCINLLLMESFLQSMCMPSWAKPVVAQISSGLGAKATEEALWSLLVRQENEARQEPPDVLGDDLGWSDLEECVDTVSREIEELLVEELEAEFL